MSGTRLAEIDAALQRLARLHTDGVLSEAEFVQSKRALLVRDPSPTTAPPPVIEDTRRKALPWLLAGMFVVVVLTGVLLLVPSVRLPAGRLVSAHAIKSTLPPDAAPAAKPVDRVQVAITDHVLQRPWDLDDDVKNHFISTSCLDEPVTLTNRATQRLTIGIHAYEPQGAMVPLGTLKPGDSIRFTPRSTGQYLIARNPTGQSNDLYELDVRACRDGKPR